jgi:hypothetical protein
MLTKIFQQASKHPIVYITTLQQLHPLQSSEFGMNPFCNSPDICYENFPYPRLVEVQGLPDRSTARLNLLL